MNFDFKKALKTWRTQQARIKGVSPEYLNELESSLHDHYEAQLIKGLKPASAFALACERVAPVGMRQQSNSSINWIRLLPNHLKVGWRNLKRRKWFALVNFLCLAVGTLVVALAALYIDYESSYDTFVPDHERKYRVGRKYRSQSYSVVGFPSYFGSSSEEQMSQLLAYENVPGIIRAAQFFEFTGPTFVYRDQDRFEVENILQTNTPDRLIDFFGWEFLLGDQSLFADQPQTAILTASEAQRLYGLDWKDEDIIGQSIRIDTVAYTLAGVLADPPPNAHFTFTMILHQKRIDYWGGRIYAELAPGATASDVSKNIEQNLGLINPGLADDELHSGTLLQPLADIHLHSDLLYELRPPGDPRYLYIIGIIAAIILLLTVCNYTNLAMVMQLKRRREIGMRKVFGASSGQVVGQFVLEGLLLSFLSVPFVAFGLWYILPRFNALMDTQIMSERLLQAQLWIYIGLGALLVGLLASLLPAILLSRRPILQLFRQKMVPTGGGKIGLRKFIIGFQFALLIGLTSLTLFVNQQLNYMQDKDLGYTKDGIMYVVMNADSALYSTFKAEMEKEPEVQIVGSNGFMGTESYNQTTYRLEGTADIFDDAHIVDMDYDAAKALGIKTSMDQRLANSNDMPATTVLINRTLADRYQTRFGINEADLIGKVITQEPEYTDPETNEIGFPINIEGIFEDIYMFSLHQQVEPMILTLHKAPYYPFWATIAYRDSSPIDIRQKAENIFSELSTTEPFIHRFLTENLEELYAAENRIARLSIFFSLIAFLVAALGLITLTAYLTTVRRKEIGIRKILGASTHRLLGRSQIEYLWLLVAGLLVAVPLTYYWTNRWLNGFAYRVDINWWVFGVAAAITLSLCLITVSTVVWQTAKKLPVDNLGNGA
ncbi:MAG: FtsX-like permease family protein [Bacteroidota bacterium]